MVTHKCTFCTAVSTKLGGLGHLIPSWWWVESDVERRFFCSTACEHQRLESVLTVFKATVVKVAGRSCGQKVTGSVHKWWEDGGVRVVLWSTSKLSTAIWDLSWTLCWWNIYPPQVQWVQFNHLGCFSTLTHNNMSHHAILCSCLYQNCLGLIVYMTVSNNLTCPMECYQNLFDLFHTRIWKRAYKYV